MILKVHHQIRKSKNKLDETFATTISAIIEETYQNGNYYKGKSIDWRSKTKNNCKSGVIRPYDITSDNSINSAPNCRFEVIIW